MKSYDEMASSALKQVKQYENKRRQKRKMIKRTLLPVCLVIALSVVAFQGETLQKNDIFKNERTKTETTDEIIINQDNVSVLDNASYKLAIELSPNDAIHLDQDGINQYFGMNIFPTVPSDLSSWQDDDDFNGYRIYRKNNEVYWDQQVLNYTNEDFTRSVNLEVAKDDLPLMDFLLDQAKATQSVIANHAVYIEYGQDGYYQARFICERTGFVLTTTGLSQTEVIAVIESLLVHQQD